MLGTHTWHSYHVLWVLIKLVEPATSWDAFAHRNMLWEKLLFPVRQLVVSVYEYHRAGVHLVVLQRLSVHGGSVLEARGAVFCGR
jgi:hypothetical protein